MQIIVRDGETETDVTEAVRIMYDTVHASMDWGSGFLDADEAGHILALADACGFEPLDDAKAGTYSNPKAEDINRAKDIRAMFQSVPRMKP